jgi:ribonuclease P protein component
LTTHFTFQRHERLKSRKLTESLFKKGHSFAVFPFRVVYMTTATGFEIPEAKSFKHNCPAQMGVGVGARHFKKAVDRNRIKRITREAWRVQKATLYHSLHEKKIQAAVFLIYQSKEKLDHSTISAAIQEVIQKLIRRTEAVKS